MDGMDSDALVVDLPDDGDPEPGLESDDEHEEGAIIVRDSDGLGAQMEDGFEVAKLSDGEFLELLAEVLIAYLI